MWPFSKKPDLIFSPAPREEYWEDGEGHWLPEAETPLQRELRETREALQKKAETPGKKRQYVILTETGQSHVVQSLMDIRSQWLLALWERENTVTFTDEDGEDSATYRTDFIKGIIVADVTKEKEK